MKTTINEDIVRLHVQSEFIDINTVEEAVDFFIEYAKKENEELEYVVGENMSVVSKTEFINEAKDYIKNYVEGYGPFKDYYDEVTEGREDLFGGVVYLSEGLYVNSNGDIIDY